jgi:hypothetical protein
MTKPIKSSTGVSLDKRLHKITALAQAVRDGSLDDKGRVWLADALARIGDGADPMDALDVRGGKGQSRTPQERAQSRRIIDAVFRVESLIDAEVGALREGRAYDEALRKACNVVGKQLKMKSERVRTIWEQNPEWRGMDFFAYLQAV